MALVLQPTNSLVEVDLAEVEGRIKEQLADSKEIDGPAPRRRRLVIDQVGEPACNESMAAPAAEKPKLIKHTPKNTPPSIDLTTTTIPKLLSNPVLVSSVDDPKPITHPEITTKVKEIQHPPATNSNTAAEFIPETTKSANEADNVQLKQPAAKPKPASQLPSTFPVTMFDFEREWKTRKANPRELYAFLLNIQPSVLVKLFKNSLESHYLTGIIEIVHDFYIMYFSLI